MVHPDAIKSAVSESKVTQNIRTVTEGEQRSDRLYETVAKVVGVCIILGFALLLFNRKQMI